MGLLDFLFKKPNESNDKASNDKSTWVDAQYIKDPKEKEKFLLSLTQKTKNPIDLHFTYNQLIDLYYKQRDEWNHALSDCIKYCKKDINKMDEIIREFKKDPSYKKNGSLPRMPSFERLAIIYDKQGNYQEAINICKKAISYGLNDKTKGGFKGRIERLEKKLN
ncbi:tetratricopeptide repeat protein [Piscibacillus sp. B03]|uniref:tetratricopeptide repeat protein n=1 Tax=Piscibacillus sp. B03 TaxID=3457430 RepID=UPI003FCDC97A